MEEYTEATVESSSSPSNGPRFQHNRMGRVFGGIVILTVGVFLLMRRAGVELPDFLFSGRMFLVVLGLYIWSRHAFQKSPGLILMLFGGILLLGDFFPDIAFGRFVWPSIIIAAGVWMIFSSGSQRRREQMHTRWSQKKKDFASPNQAVNEEDFLNSTTIFGGIKKRYFSRNFKGGKLTCMMGGVEVDLGNCDIQEPVIIEITQVFGGTKLIVPSNWQIRSELVAIAGGVEDKRYQPVAGIEDDAKLLILKGTTIFGGIDIKSY